MAEPLDKTLAFTPKFDANGLIPAVTIEQSSGKPLMLAYMNEDAVKKTLETGYAHFWSRSKASLWQKGETSGNRLKILDVLIDCDQDTLCLIVDVEGEGAACHTGRQSCFYRRLSLEEAQEDKIKLELTDDVPLFDPAQVYGHKA